MQMTTAVKKDQTYVYKYLSAYYDNNCKLPAEKIHAVTLLVHVDHMKWVTWDTSHVTKTYFIITITATATAALLLLHYYYH